jgi:hypothetical protein
MGWLKEIGYARSLNFEVCHEPALFAGSLAEFVVRMMRQIGRVVRVD